LLWYKKEEIKNALWCKKAALKNIFWYKKHFLEENLWKFYNKNKKWVWGVGAVGVAMMGTAWMASMYYRNLPTEVVTARSETLPTLSHLKS